MKVTGVSVGFFLVVVPAGKAGASLVTIGAGVLVGVATAFVDRMIGT